MSIDGNAKSVDLTQAKIIGSYKVKTTRSNTGLTEKNIGKIGQSDMKKILEDVTIELVNITYGFKLSGFISDYSTKSFTYKNKILPSNILSVNSEGEISISGKDSNNLKLSKEEVLHIRLNKVVALGDGFVCDDEIKISSLSAEFNCTKTVRLGIDNKLEQFETTLEVANIEGQTENRYPCEAGLGFDKEEWKSEYQRYSVCQKNKTDNCDKENEAVAAVAMGKEVFISNSRKSKVYENRIAKVKTTKFGSELFNENDELVLKISPNQGLDESTQCRKF